jgi:DNA/RNA-binding domain of Phe-tRNA-synthetase-like protein
VDANFMAEVETLILTATHDGDKLRGPIVIDVSREGDKMTQMNGAARAIRAGDKITRDAEGVSCSIIYGQDVRSPILPKTSRALSGGSPPDAHTARYVCRTCSSARNAAIEPW